MKDKFITWFPKREEIQNIIWEQKAFLSDLCFAQIVSAFPFGRGGIYNIRSKLWLTYALTSFAQLLNTTKENMPGVSDWLLKISLKIR